MRLPAMVRNAGVTLGLIALLLVSACQPQAVPVTGITVSITANDFSFTAPDSVNAGMTTIVLDNQGKEPHHAQLVRLNDSVTLDQFNAALEKGPEELLSIVSAEGGPGTVQPQGKQTVTVNLRPGQYVLVCFISGADGVPHAAKGMVKAFTVNPGGSTQNRSVEPKADQTVTMKDFAFEIPAQVKAGPQTWKVVNAGPQVHEMGIVKLNPGTTFQDLQAMISSNQTMSGPPPFTEAGGFQAISPGLTGWMTLNLEPGEYAAFCFVPDPATGKAHVDLGMMAGFTVQ